MPRVNSNTRGVSLIELIIAIVILSVAVVIISLTFPRVSLTLTHNRQRMVASNFGASRMEELKQETYDYLIVNDQTNFGSDLTCDCRLVNFGAFPSTDTFLVDGGITFTRKTCVHLVDTSASPPTSACPDDPLTSATDKGTKNIRVYVSWTSGGKNYSTESESLVSR